MLQSRKLARRALLIVFGCALATAIGEVAVRAGRRFLPADVRDNLDASLADIAYRPHPYVNWEPKPGVRMRSGETLNAYGFRGPKRPMAKPDSAFRVACIGGSTTFSTGVPDTRTYPVCLEVELSRRFPERRVEVLNAGVPGYTSAESLMNLAFKVLDHEPDAVVVYHAINDYRPRVAPGYRTDYRHYRSVWVAEESSVGPLVRMAENSALFRLLRLRFTDHRKRTTLYYWVSTFPDAARPVAIEPWQHMAGFHRNMSAIVDVCLGRGIHPVLVTQAFQDRVLGRTARALEAHNELVRALAAERDVTLADAREGFPQELTFRPEDPVHMTHLGTAELARRVADAIERAGLLDHPAPRSRLRTADADPDASDVPVPPAGAATHAFSPDLERLAAGSLAREAPYFGYELAPDLPAERALGPHDALGLRGQDRRGTTEDSDLVLCLGGASTYGVGVEESDTWPRILERRLREGGMTGASVSNAGVPGYTTAESIGAFHFKWRDLAPSVVVIAHDAEDLLPIEAPNYRADYAHWRRTFRAPSSVAAMAGAERPAGTDPLGSGAPLASIRSPQAEFDPGAWRAVPRAYAVYRNVRTLIDLARGSGAEVIVLAAGPGGGSETAEKAAVMWNRAASLAAEDSGAAFVGMNGRLDAESYFPDCDWLIDRDGHQRRADACEKAVRVAVEARRTRAG